MKGGKGEGGEGKGERQLSSPFSFPPSPFPFLFLLILFLPATSPAQGQSVPETEGWDARMLRSVYAHEAPGFRKTMNLVNRTAYPVFIAVPVVAWGKALATGASADRAAAYRMTLAEATGVVVTIGLKRLVKRRRPYTELSGIRARSHDAGARMQRRDPYAFPSGHATLAFAIATSWALTTPHAYVWMPTMVWACGVGVSRVWLGVHYPSDVLAGAALGVLAGLWVYLLESTLSPPGLRRDSRSAGPSMLHLRIRFP